ncbi:MAG TPA: hypothetical protein VJJ77_08945, partial [Dongiaceae bacterium]|nr:hypothetical protein [Dongiaceae bacterium]
FLVAACGSPIVSRTPPGASPTPRATPVATAFVPVDTPPPSGQHADWPLEHALPLGVGGLAYRTESLHGDEAFNFGEVGEMGRLLASACREIEHLSLAYAVAGPPDAMRVNLYRLAGADTTRLRGAYVNAFWAPPASTRRLFRR